jgi:hypothetical protein
MIQALKSIKRELGAGKRARVFSSFDDFTNALLGNGTIKSKVELITTNRDLLGEILFEWYIQGQIACVFAQKLARDATKAGEATTWQTIVTDAAVNVGELQGLLLNAAAEKEATQLIFLGPATAEHVVQIILALCKHESWICFEKGWKKGEQGDALLIGLRWTPPDSDYASWVLGIGDFDPMAFTRRFVGAPFIALVLRPGPPRPEYASVPIEGKFKGSHLAHMDNHLGGDKAKAIRTRERTEYNKDVLLGDELRSHARAQTTFALPPSCREALGDVLRPVEEA